MKVITTKSKDFNNATIHTVYIFDNRKYLMLTIRLDYMIQSFVGTKEEFDDWAGKDGESLKETKLEDSNYRYLIKKMFTDNYLIKDIIQL